MQEGRPADRLITTVTQAFIALPEYWLAPMLVLVFALKLSLLPSAGWEARAPRTWGFPMALFLLLGMISAAIIGSGSTLGEHSGVGALSAVVGMFQATVLAGSGMLAASWKGFGLVFEQMLASPVSLGMFGVFVLCLNLLLVSMIRRKRTGLATAASRATLSRGLDETRH